MLGSKLGLASCIALEWRPRGGHCPSMPVPVRKMVLACSGGLDTSVVLARLHPTIGRADASGIIGLNALAPHSLARRPAN